MKEQDELIEIKAGTIRLEGNLKMPQKANGVVLFAHGSGSSRHSVRNNFVAGVLRDAGICTLLFDLLTEDESENRANVFDIDLLAKRLLYATEWASRDKRVSDLSIGYFGASTGAAAALLASVQSPIEIKAIVSRGGRPDMAMPILPRVNAPTLLIVGGDDIEVLELNKAALSALRVEKELKVVPGATHLFEEPGKLKVVAALARDWFMKHFTGAKAG